MTGPAIDSASLAAADAAAQDAAAQTELDRMIDSIQASGGLNVVLWVVSLVAAMAAVGWVMFGGPGAESTIRSDAITKLWPLGAAWFAALAAKSKITSGQKREVVRAHAMLSSQRMTHAATAAHAAGGPRPVVIATTGRGPDAP